MKRSTYRAECDPVRIRAELARLELLKQARPKPAVVCPPDYTAQAAAALWMAELYERVREQWGRLAEWARLTNQPGTLREGIYKAERQALAQGLGARARSAQWQRTQLVETAPVAGFDLAVA